MLHCWIVSLSSTCIDKLCVMLHDLLDQALLLKLYQSPSGERSSNF